MCGTLNFDHHQRLNVHQKRFQWHFSVITYIAGNQHLKDIFTCILTKQASAWHDDIKEKAVDQLIKGTFEFYDQFKFKQSPDSFA